MMFDPRQWMDVLKGRLLDAFGPRLLFLGLQGSHRRGEAAAASDIDAVVILDRLELADLRIYRHIVLALPHSELACGFIGGRDELLRWPRHELFQFRLDTESFHGDLDALLPAVSREDIRDSVTFAASGIYHMVCHLYVHGGEDRVEELRGAYKGSFFILLALHYLRTGEYAGSRRELLSRLDGIERDILAAAVDWGGPLPDRKARPDHYFELLLQWSGKLVTGENL